MFCRKCGNQINDEQARFCPKCGEAIVRMDMQTVTTKERVPDKTAQDFDSALASKASSRKKVRKAIIFIPLVVVFIVASLILLNVFKPKKVADTTRNIKAGDIIEFGTYEQDNDIENGKEPIEWIVLEIEDNKAFIISKYQVDTMPFSENEDSVFWEKSSVRNWLNGDFLNNSFTEAEKEKICLTAANNPAVYMGVDEDGCWRITTSYGELADVYVETESGSPTNDYVFLLAINEFQSLLNSENANRTQLTEWAKEKYINAAVDEATEAGVGNREIIYQRYEQLEQEYGEGFCSWWLRAVGSNQKTAFIVDYMDSNIQIQQCNRYAGIRPAMWITIDDRFTGG